jgi:glycosyltransferase involved in cell wall biosynthesis
MTNSSQRRLRILFVATGYPTPYRPNQSIFTHRSIQQLSKYVDPKVIHFRSWLPGRPWVEKRKLDGIDVLSLSIPQLPGGSTLHLNAKLLAWLGRMFAGAQLKETDLIHSTDLYPAGFVGSQWSKLTKKPHTTHVIGSDLNLFLAPKLRSIGSEWLMKINGFACNSTAILNALTRMAPGLKNATVIYRGVDTNLFSPHGAAGGPQASLPPVRFLYLGGFHSWDPRQVDYYNLKGGHILLEAWQKVEDKVQPGSLLIGGPGADKGKLEEWRQTLHFPQAVFFAGTIPPAEIPSTIRACDVVVIPSLQEGLPNVANEAQSSGRPVLGTDAGGIPEAVLHEQTGLIIPRGDPDRLAQGIEWFFFHQNEMVQMGSKGRDRALTQFSWDRFSIQMTTLFQNAVENN